VHVRLALLVSIAVACGSPRADAPPTPPARPPAPPAPEPTPTPIAEIHEWGLVDVDLTSGTVELSTGPGVPAWPVIARKPVLYVHLLGADRATLDVRATVPGGAILEHWPAGALGEGSIAWHVGVSRGACADVARWLTVARETTACTAPDGFCEVAELPRYATDDADCLDVGGVQASLLFYRASVRADALPLRVERGADMVVRVTGATSDAPRPMLRLSTALSGPWPMGHVVVARADRPTGAAVALPVGTVAVDRAAERAVMTRTLGELGLTAAEARVFCDAWAGALFGEDPGAARRGPLAASMSQDVVLYWLSPAEVSRLAVLDVGPAPVAIRRAFLVRVVLPGVDTA
jgi:hypothetical protein